MHKREIHKNDFKSGIICLQPFYFMEFTTYGEVYTCCPSWVKFSIGSIKNKTIAEIWNSDEARYIRRKMFRGEWQKICNPICPRLSVYRHDKKLILYDYLDTFDSLTPQLINEIKSRYDYLDTFDSLTPQLINEIKSRKEYLESSPTVFNLSNSRVCNLSCIMCDRVSQEDNHELIEKTARDIFTYLPTAKKLILTGMGDPLARPDTRNLLINYKGQNPDFKFDIITNALLLPKYWEQIKHQNFGTLLISIDAATKETYEKIRVGGSWITLLQSLSVVRENIVRFSSVTINMTVMRYNYKEISEFIDLAESYGFGVSFQRVRGTFSDQNIFDLGDAAALGELRRIISGEQYKKRSINVFWGDLLEFVEDDSIMNKTLLLSIIICTYNRASFLKQVLGSLTNQTVSRDEFEIIIIDDGSSDNTRDIVESFAHLLQIKYFYQNNAGLASAKNHGIYAAQGKMLLFLDDDDVAVPTLLEEHVKTHREYPEVNYAVLHYTAWSSNLSITPLMHFITEIGIFLFSYPDIKHGDILNYTYFWGGRSSCKREFLIEYGVFNPVFSFGCEDIELGYRLSRHGLRVVFNSKAVCMMTRPVTFDDFCQRLIKQGRSQYIFSTLHNDPDIHAWAEVTGAEEKWDKIRTVYKAKTRSARELDKIANMKLKLNFEIDAVTKKLLYESYWWAFRACKIKGILDAKSVYTV